MLLRRLGVGLLGLLVLAFLVLNVLAWSGALAGDDSAAIPKTSPADTQAPDLEPAEEPPPPAPEPPAEPVAQERPTGPADGMSLTVTATRGDCWVEVRAGSATGQALYAGTLATGRSIKFNRPKLWLRLGAASNVDVVVNGQPSSVPPGTVELTLPDA